MEAAELPEAAVFETALRAHTPIGELLVRAGHLTWERLEQALAEQRSLAESTRIGEVLIARGWLSPKALAQALAEQHGLEFVDLAHVEVEPQAASLLTEQFAQGAQVLPVRFLEEGLGQGAVADPA